MKGIKKPRENKAIQLKGGFLISKTLRVYIDLKGKLTVYCILNHGDCGELQKSSDSILDF